MRVIAILRERQDNESMLFLDVKTYDEEKCREGTPLVELALQKMLVLLELNKDKELKDAINKKRLDVIIKIYTPKTIFSFQPSELKAYHRYNIPITFFLNE